MRVDDDFRSDLATETSALPGTARGTVTFNMVIWRSELLRDLRSGAQYSCLAQRIAEASHRSPTCCQPRRSD